MRTLKFSSMILVFCIMTLLVSTYSSPVLAKATPKETVSQAYQKLASLRNYHMTLNVATSMMTTGINMNYVVKSELDIQQNPMMCKNNMSTSLEIGSPKNEQTITQYIEEVGDNITIYSQINNKWSKQSMPKGDYNPLSEYDNYMQAITSVTQKSEDANATVFEVIADGHALKDNLQQQLSKINIKQTLLTDEILNNLGDLHYTVTIDKKNGSISNIDMDLSTFISSLGNALTRSQDIPDAQKQMIKDIFTNMNMTSNVSLSQFNRVEKISIPEAAKK